MRCILAQDISVAGFIRGECFKHDAQIGSSEGEAGIA